MKNYQKEQKNGLKNLRKSLVLSQVDLSKLLKVTSACISNYEKNKRKIPVDTAYFLISIAKLSGLEISLEDIYLR